MTPELEKYYNNYFDLFNNEGWKQLKQDFANNAASINSVESTKDVDDLNFRKGQLSVIAHIINMEALIEQGYEDAQESSEDV